MSTEDLIDAAEAYISSYAGDDREDIETDVLNAFYAGAKFVSVEHAALAATINKAWADTYPGSVDTQDLNALQCRIKNLAEDRNCWVFNAKVANNKLNELEGKR